MMHFLSMTDLDSEQIGELLKLSARLKSGEVDGAGKSLQGQMLALLFEKPSTRTRVSFEVAMTKLGGASLFLDTSQLQLSRGETIADTARVLSRYVSAVAARVVNHSTLEELATDSTVPVINALSDVEHPCQVLADLLTISEKLGKLKGVKVTWVGDGNNVCNSWLLAAALTGIELTVATPAELQPDKKIVERALSMGGRIKLTGEPSKAVEGADVIYTDVWVSMGDETGAKRRTELLKPFQVNEELVNSAKPDAIVMHCLPAHRGQEITGGVMDGPQSVVFDQAENRMHAQKALLYRMLVM